MDDLLQNLLRPSLVELLCLLIAFFFYDHEERTFKTLEGVITEDELKEQHPDLAPFFSEFQNLGKLLRVFQQDQAGIGILLSLVLLQSGTKIFLTGIQTILSKHRIANFLKIFGFPEIFKFLLHFGKSLGLQKISIFNNLFVNFGKCSL